MCVWVFIHNLSLSILYHKLNTVPFNKPNTNDQITGRKLHSAFCRIWYIVVWDYFRQMQLPCIILKCWRKVLGDLMANEGFILACFFQCSVLFQPPVCGFISKCQSWLIERIAIYCVSPAFCVMDRGTWDKHAALVELAFSPFNRGWHFYCSECRAKLHRYEKMVSLYSLLKKQL